MRSTTRMFMLGLTISDSIHILNDLLYFVCLFVNIFDVKISMHMIDYVYPYTNYVFHATVMYSAWMTVSISTERYVNVCHSKRALYIITYTRAVVAVLVIAVITLIISVPHSDNMFYLVTSNVSFQAEIRHMALGNIFNACYYTIRFIVPVLCLVTFSALILYRLKDVRIRNGKRRTTINLILAVSSFIFCSTPDVIVSTISRFHGTNDLLEGISELTNFILLLNCSINTTIYCGLNKRFMKTLKTICRKSWMELSKFLENQRWLYMFEWLYLIWKLLIIKYIVFDFKLNILLLYFIFHFMSHMCCFVCPECNYVYWSHCYDLKILNVFPFCFGG